MKNKISGITLIELMIVIAIVGILASIAYPSYQAHVIKTHRATSTGTLLELTQFMERYYSETGGYNGAVIPTELRQSPPDGSAAKYSIAFSDGTTTAGAGLATAYILVATPTGSQTDDTQCGAIGINSVGVKCITGGSKCSNVAAQSAAVSECW